ncbi:MAG: hypothetical protein P4L49_12590 [Desulfosporosinus sp.]|nr:hypothetical protein [Desulfosporosinus sp.]
MHDQLVAEIHHDEDTNLLSMEIINPDIFFGRLDKLYFNDAMVRRWIESRLTPEYQGEYDKFLYKLGLTGNEPDVRWQVFLRTRATNVKDKMWLAFKKDETYEEGSPWYKLLNPDLFPGAVKEITCHVMLFNTLSQLNLEGANIKELLRYNGELVVVKKPLQDNCYANISEVIAYEIAVLIGVPCARAGLLDDERVYSVIDEWVKGNLVHACDLLKLDEGSVCDIYDKLERINVNERIKFRFLQMLLFDVLIRQVDRNMTNFSFIIIDKCLDMYIWSALFEKVIQ